MPLPCYNKLINVAREKGMNTHIEWIIERREQLARTADGTYGEIDDWILNQYTGATLGETAYALSLPEPFVTFLVIRATARLMLREWYTPKERELL